VTMSRSSVTATSIAIASRLMAEVGIPALQESCAVLEHKRSQPIQLMRAKNTPQG
jgi:hypothetical protein